MAVATAEKKIEAKDPGQLATGNVPQFSRVMVNADQIKLLEHVSTSWMVIAPPSHSLEQVMDPRYLWNRAHEMKPRDTIRISHALWYFRVDIEVREIDAEAQAIIGYYDVLNYLEKDLRAPDLTSAEIDYLGDSLLWGAKVGSHVLKHGFETELQAIAWLENRQNRVANAKKKNAIGRRGE